MQDAPREAQEMFANLVRGFHDDNNKAERAAAERDPKRHKLSRVFAGPGGLNYHYTFGGMNGKKQRVYFCWSIHRNVAGYFLGWRQIKQANGVTKRDMWLARRSRKAVRAIANKRGAAMDAQKKPPTYPDPIAKVLAERICPFTQQPCRSPKMCSSGCTAIPLRASEVGI